MVLKKKAHYERGITVVPAVHGYKNGEPIIKDTDILDLTEASFRVAILSILYRCAALKPLGNATYYAKGFDSKKDQDRGSVAAPGQSQPTSSSAPVTPSPDEGELDAQ